MSSAVLSVSAAIWQPIHFPRSLVCYRPYETRAVGIENHFGVHSSFAALLHLICSLVDGICLIKDIVGCVLARCALSSRANTETCPSFYLTKGDRMQLSVTLMQRKTIEFQFSLLRTVGL